jgi:hypothetical protein
VSAALKPFVATVALVTTQALTTTSNDRVYVVAEGYETSEANICMGYVPMSALVVGFTVICLVEAFIVMKE